MKIRYIDESFLLQSAGCWNHRRESSSYVFTPAGKLVSFYNNSFDCDVMDKFIETTPTGFQGKLIRSYNFSWIFHLAQSLRLNFTIITLHSFPASSCFYGYLTFSDQLT